MRRTVKTIASWLLLLLLLTGCELSATPQAAPSTPISVGASTREPTPTLMPISERLEIFKEVWQTVHENYLYTDFNGVDWKALREEYGVKTLTAKSAEQFYAITDEMIELLNDDHSIYLPPWDAAEEDRADAGDNHYIGTGISAFYRENSILIIDVFPDSPAARTGLKRGDKISAVDGVPYNWDNEVDVQFDYTEGGTVRLTVSTAGGPPREVAVTRSLITGGISPISKRLDADPSIGYLVITTLAQEDTGKQVEAELRKLLAEEDLEGLIVDLRGNGGGLISVMDEILSQFVTGEIGQDVTRDESYPIEIEKGALYDQLKAAPLAVLVDEGTASAAEVLAAGLQTKGRAKVVGLPSAGNTESIHPYDFEDGSRLWLAEYGFQLPDGTSLEGKGVQPDAVVDVDWADYSERDDPQILKAIELIRK